jgi:hypothetical protein
MTTSNLSPGGKSAPVKKHTLWKAIRAFCIECMGNISTSRSEVTYCTAPHCPLYPFRLGRPFHPGDFVYASGDEHNKVKDQEKLTLNSPISSAESLAKSITASKLMQSSHNPPIDATDR